MVQKIKKMLNVTWLVIKNLFCIFYVFSSRTWCTDYVMPGWRRDIAWVSFSVFSSVRQTYRRGANLRPPLPAFLASEMQQNGSFIGDRNKHLSPSLSHTHTHTHRHTHTHTYTHTHTHTHTDRHMHTDTHTQTHTHRHTQTHTQIDTYKHTYKHTYIHTYIHTSIHTHKHIQTYTCTRKRTRQWWYRLTLDRLFF